MSMHFTKQIIEVDELEIDEYVIMEEITKDIHLTTSYQCDMTLDEIKHHFMDDNN